MNGYMSNKLDTHLTNIKELEQTIIAFKRSFDHAMDERDMMRAEIARLQSEVQRLQLGITPDGIKVWVAMGAESLSGIGDYVIIASPDKEHIDASGYLVTNTALLVNIQPFERKVNQ